jgi:hypothetical protein
VSIFCDGCRSGKVIIERSETFSGFSNTIKSGKIIYIEPEASIYKINKEVDKDFNYEENIEKAVIKNIEESAKRNKINVSVMTGAMKKEQAAGYVNSFLRLKNDIIMANTLQDNPLDRTKKYSKQTEKIFVYSPKIFPEAAVLSQIYSTPYFGFCGIFSVNAVPKSEDARQYMKRNKKTISKGKYFYFYHIIVNVENSEIIYREIRSIPTDVDNPILYTTVYDSFYSLKNTLRR